MASRLQAPSLERPRCPGRRAATAGRPPYALHV